MRLDLEQRKVVHAMRGILRAALKKGQVALLLLLDRPDKSGVYTIWATPAVGSYLSLNVGRLFQRLVGWEEQSDNKPTYTRSMQVTGPCTLIKFCFIGVKCNIRICHVPGCLALEYGDNPLALGYADGEVESKGPIASMLMPMPMVDTAGELIKEMEEQGKKNEAFIKAYTSGSAEEDEEEAIEEEMADIGSTVLRTHPEQLSSLLCLYITLLGGTVTVRQMESLSPSARGEAFRYLRTFYRNKFFHGKEKTGKRPGFLQQYLSPKKA